MPIISLAVKEKDAIKEMHKTKVRPNKGERAKHVKAATKADKTLKNVQNTYSILTCVIKCSKTLILDVSHNNLSVIIVPWVHRNHYLALITKKHTRYKTMAKNSIKM